MSRVLGKLAFLTHIQLLASMGLSKYGTKFRELSLSELIELLLSMRTNYYLANILGIFELFIKVSALSCLVWGYCNNFDRPIL